MTRTRCPNGTRKNKIGECVNKEEHANKEPIIIKGRCPNGTRKNKVGECVKSALILNVPSPNTPRKNFANKYFGDKPIVMLDKIKLTDTEVLFQVGFGTPDQFKNYVNLSDSPKIDCFYQSLFSIGLRNVKTAKRNAADVNAKGKSGVHPQKVANYIKNSFGLKAKEKVEYIVSNPILGKSGKYDNSIANAEIKAFFNEKLKDNYTTIFVVYFRTYKDIQYAHALVAYKYKNTVYFFDPQKKGEHDDKLIMSKTLLHMTKYVGNLFISRFGHFKISNLNMPKPIINTKCNLPYMGGNLSSIFP